MAGEQWLCPVRRDVYFKAGVCKFLSVGDTPCGQSKLNKQCK